ncbi:MAG: hypothetical protein IKO60_00155, partial [Bacteroidaceae bacterium]|nr:hypothetical protein [Bacteroidaceae bacterium]
RSTLHRPTLHVASAYTPRCIDSPTFDLSPMRCRIAAKAPLFGEEFLVSLRRKRKMPSVCVHLRLWPSFSGRQ